jgi:DNA-binding response OmpR family regulator
MSPDAPIPATREKILIIAGDGAFGEHLSHALASAGYQMTLIKNGTEAMKGIYDVLPHLVILGVVLPGMDGYEILEKKAADRMVATIPVFLVATEGIPINMRRVPPGSVKEYIMTLHADTQEIVDHVNRHFSHDRHEPDRTGVVMPGTQKKIVWVEDDRFIGTILGKKIMAAGFELHLVRSGEEAKDVLTRIIPDGIVVDLLMPGVSGFDLLQAIKSDTRLKTVPVMVLSNLSKPSDVEKAKAFGVQKYLVKAANSLDRVVYDIKELCG